MATQYRRQIDADGASPHLVPPVAGVSLSRLDLWHLLSLDAPTVAAVWTSFLGTCAGVRLPWVVPVSMFLAVWMIYAADRLMDARQLDQPQAARDLEERHRFHYRHRGRFLAALVIVSFGLTLLLPRLSPRALELYGLLAALLAAWMLLIHARPPQISAQNPEGVHRLPKELAVGVFFPAAVFIPTVARAPWLQARLLPAAVLLAGLCTFNCLLIYHWEHPPFQRPHDSAHWTTLACIDHIRQIGIGLLALCVVAAATLPEVRMPAAACCLSVGSLLGLHLLRDRIRPLRLRAAADLVLLTPLPMLPFLLLQRTPR